MSGLPESRPAAAGASERGKLQRELASLLEGIAASRADLGRQAGLLRDLHHRLDRDLRPWEEKLASARRETLRILGRHCRQGWLPRRDGERLREALRGLADELESGFGLDLSSERREYLGQAALTEAEREAQAASERAGREIRLEALRKAIGGEAGPREAAAREKRDRMEKLRKALDGGRAGEDAESPAAAGGPGAEAPDGRNGRKGAGHGRPGDAGGAEPGDGPEKAGRARAGSTGGTRARNGTGAAGDEPAVAGDIRAVYLVLARALHPDKEADPARREAKTAWMQKVTAAYGARDLPGLLDILARDPLGSVGPYLSSAPLAAVKGFAKRLRRELAALRAKADAGRSGLHPSLRRFMGSRGIDEAEVKRYSAAIKKEVRFVKERNEWYRERSGVEEMLKAMGGDWRGYL